MGWNRGKMSREWWGFKIKQAVNWENTRWVAGPAPFRKPPLKHKAAISVELFNRSLKLLLVQRQAPSELLWCYYTDYRLHYSDGSHLVFRALAQPPVLKQSIEPSQACSNTARSPNPFNMRSIFLYYRLRVHVHSPLCSPVVYASCGARCDLSSFSGPLVCDGPWPLAAEGGFVWYGWPSGIYTRHRWYLQGLAGQAVLPLSDLNSQPVSMWTCAYLDECMYGKNLEFNV